MKGLVIVETHPVQYHAPVWRAAAQDHGVPLQVVYGGDFSVRGYRDREFGASFQWDGDLLEGYPSQVLRPMKEGGAAEYDQVTAGGLAGALDALQPAAVMALGYHHVMDRAVLREARRRRVPLIFRGETSDVSRPGRGRLKSWLRDSMLRLLYRRCAVCLYLGERSKAHYLRLGVPEAKLVRSPYCVDDRSFACAEADRLRLREETRTRLGIPEDAWVVLFSGKLSRRKGVDLLPEAVRGLPEALRRRTHLLLVGDGDRREALAAACQAEPRVGATFTGFQNQSQLSAFYHAGDVLVLPSLEMETWGLVVNDALHHGLPCVVSAGVGCAPDLVVPGATGEVCVAGDAGLLGRALAACAEWSGRDDAAVRGRCRARVQNYTVAKAAEGVAQAWERVRG